jgi:hypothetical protein
MVMGGLHDLRESLNHQTEIPRGVVYHFLYQGIFHPSPQIS